jgi:hypothetical protein
MFNYIVRKSIRENLSREGWNRYSRRLSFKDIAEMLEIAVTTTDGGRLEFECRDVGLGGG